MTDVDLSAATGLPVPPHRGDLVLDTLTPDGLEDYLQTVVRGFHGEFHSEDFDVERDLLETERCFGFRAGDRWVATTISFAQQLAVPGGSVPTAAVTWVTVAPAFRRQGLLTRMMRHQLDTVPEPVSLLWPTESLIYGRFGYGQATRRLRLSGLTREMNYLPGVDLGPGSVDEVSADVFRSAAAGVRAALLDRRPGHLTRDVGWWRRTLHDPERFRGGAGPLRYALHFADDGSPDGFATFRIKRESSLTDLGREVIIHDLDAATPAAYAALWRWLLDLDLVRAFSKSSAPVDEPLLQLVDNPRMIKAELTDGSYARLIDVPAALQARRYAAELDLVLEVADTFRPESGGRFRLRGGPDGAEVTRTDQAPDLTVTARQLASLYLGAFTARSFATAGFLTEHSAGSVNRVSVAFAADRAAYCPDFF